MANLKTDLWKKAYLIEFLDGNTTKASFTFSVPPESEELTYSQRKTETRTFGGLHVDDYGIDTVKISLSGSTINQDLKKIYHPESGIELLSGEDEIYGFMELLKTWKTGQDNISKEIMLYDLSKTGSTGFATRHCWRVFPGDLKIRRSSDRPFTYKYSIDFTGVDPDKLNAKRVENALLTMTTEVSPQGLLDKMKAGLDKFRNITAKLDAVNKALKEIEYSIAEFESVLRMYANAIADNVESFLDIISNAVNLADTVFSIPRDISTMMIDLRVRNMNAAMRLVKNCVKFGQTIQSAADARHSWAEENTLRQYGLTVAEFWDVLSVEANNLEDNANAAAVWSKSADMPVVTVGGLDPSTGASRLVLSYGDSEAVLKSTDTLESLAAHYYGSPDKALDIAAYNGVASIDELQPGSTIRIPVLRQSQRNAQNRIYARPEDRDNYGRDIALTDEGDIRVSPQGDYMTVSGADNLAQAVLLRLRESVTNRVRLNAYGIRTNISDPAAGIAYILSSVDLTVRSDPRVKSVDNIRFSGAGDSLDIKVDYSDIDDAGGGVAGRI